MVKVNNFLALSSIFLFGKSIFCQSITLDIEKDIVIPKHYVVHKSYKSIIIDGQDTEDEWQGAKFTEKFIDIEGILNPKQNTQAKMLWDKKYLYIFAKIEETQIWATLKERDTIIFYNNDFEIFIDPSNDTYDYGEIEINALNTIWDLMLDRPYRSGGKAINHWNLNELKSAIHISGTLNNSSDTDNYWSVEMAIPMKALLELKKQSSLPSEGEQWRLNFSRVEWDYQLNDGRYERKKDSKGNYLPEYNWVWSNQKLINMHEPEKWGYIQFTHSAVKRYVKYQIPDDLLMRQVIFAIFRKCLSREINLIKSVDVGKQIQFELLDLEGKNQNFEVTYLRTFQGYNIRVRDTDKNITFVIDNFGHLEKIN